MKFRMSLRSFVAALLVTAPGLVALAQSTPPAAPTAPPTIEQPKLIHVLMTTNKGEITIELNREKAPISVDNYLAYVDTKFYDGTIFHRVMPNFMIQGGGFTPDMTQKATNAPIKNEWQNGLKNSRGTLAMARLGDRKPNLATVNSGTSQFFINVVDNPRLDEPQADGGAYAVFGKVIAGMAVVDAIKVVPTSTHASGHGNVPVEPVVIEKVARISAADAQKKVDAEKKPAAPAAAPASN